MPAIDSNRHIRPVLSAPATAVRRALFLLSMPLALGTAGVAHAQTSTDTSADTKSQNALPTVSVSATSTPSDTQSPTFGGGQIAKRATLGVFGNQALINLPFNVTSYTEKAVKDSQKRTVAEFLQATDPNVRTVSTVGTLNQQMIIRGFELYSDDVALNGLYGLTPRTMVNTAAVGGVDVFQGASAFVFGAPTGGSGVGGMVNVNLKHADDKPLTEVTASMSGSGQVGGHLDVGRRFGDNDQFGIRFNQSDDSGRTSVSGQKQYNKTTAVDLDWRGDKVRLTADFLYQRAKTNQGRGSLLFSDAIPSVPSATSNISEQPFVYSNFEDTVGMLGAEYDFAPNWTAYVKGGVRHGNERSYILFPSYNGATGLVGTTPFQTAYQADASTVEGGVHGKFDTGPISHQVNLSASVTALQEKGAYIYGTPFTTTLSNVATVATPVNTSGLNDFGSPARTSEKVTRGISLSDTFGFFNDRVLFTAGVRRQELRQDTYNYGTGTLASSYDKSITSPIFGLVYKPLENVALYANRTEGLVAGGVAPAYATNANQSFAPFRAKQWEVGGKYDLGTFGVNVALFQIEQPNAITAVTSAGSTYMQNDQRNRGIEIAVHGEPMHGLRLNAGASYTASTLLETGTPAYNGNAAVGVPKWLANVNAEYDIQQVQGLTVTGAWVFSGNQFANQANTLKIGSWSRFDLGARYKTQVFRKDVTVRATVENVANRAYWASTYSGYLTQGNPRTFWLSLTTDF